MGITKKPNATKQDLLKLPQLSVYDTKKPIGNIPVESEIDPNLPPDVNFPYPKKN